MWMNECFTFGDKVKQGMKRFFVGVELLIDSCSVGAKIDESSVSRILDGGAFGCLQWL